MKLAIYFLKILPSRVELPQKVPTGRAVFLSGFLLCEGILFGGSYE